MSAIINKKNIYIVIKQEDAKKYLSKEAAFLQQKKQGKIEEGLRLFSDWF